MNTLDRIFIVLNTVTIIASVLIIFAFIEKSIDKTGDVIVQNCDIAHGME